jgi:hypothetical protein
MCMSLSINHHRQKPTENSERFYPSLFENGTERQTWEENGMYYPESSLQYRASSLTYSVVSRRRKIFRRKVSVLGWLLRFGPMWKDIILAYLNMWRVFSQCPRPRLLYRIQRLAPTGTSPSQMRCGGKGQK